MSDVREAAGVELLAHALAAALKAPGWRGDIGPAVKAATVAILRRGGDHDMADVIAPMPCHVQVEGREAP